MKLLVDRIVLDFILLEPSPCHILQKCILKTWYQTQQLMHLLPDGAASVRASKIWGRMPTLGLRQFITFSIGLCWTSSTNGTWSAGSTMPPNLVVIQNSWYDEECVIQGDASVWSNSGYWYTQTSKSNRPTLCEEEEEIVLLAKFEDWFEDK